MRPHEEWLSEYAKQVLIAWPGLFAIIFFLTVFLGLLTNSMSSFLLDIPNSAPFFGGWVIAGALLGYWMNRRGRRVPACLVFIPPVLFFLLVAHGDYTSAWPYGGLPTVWREYFSKNCGSSECLDEFLATAPMYAAVAYSLGALWARVWPRFHASKDKLAPPLAQ